MGDRANVRVMDGPARAPVYLYTHWGGTQLPLRVREALKRQVRWHDPAYLTRIIFDTMTGDSHGSETGHGISTGVCDNEHAIIEVDVSTQKVRFLKWDWREDKEGASLATWTFLDYITIDDATINQAYGV